MRPCDPLRPKLVEACAKPFDNLRTGSVEAAMANQYLIEQPYGVDAAVVTGVPPVAWVSAART